MKSGSMILVSLLCSISLASAQEEMDSAGAKDLMKSQMALIAKYPGLTHWMGVKKCINDYLQPVGEQLTAGDTAINGEFDHRYFLTLVQNVQLKLAMPSVTAEDKENILTELKLYLAEDGYFNAVLQVLTEKLGTEYSESQEIRKILINTQYIMTALNMLKEKLEHPEEENS